MGSSFRDLVVRQRAIRLCIAVYSLTAGFPSTEQFGLTNQLRRASVSVASNIAEGWGRATRGEYIQFLGPARGSVCEIQTQLAISEALNFGSKDSRSQVESLCADVSRLLNALMRKMQK
jgi:four helix bundle protein